MTGGGCLPEAAHAMNEKTITLKSVSELRVDPSDQPIRYRIAAYQRGYRWSPQQVTQLLDDLWEFTQREDPRAEDFYCLQPLVLKPNDDGAYEVVDGQQRLTTLLLVLRHFNDRNTIKYRLKLYTLEYETRADLLSFLEDPSAERAAANIDYFHIARAVRIIEAWFAAREIDVEAIKTVFLKQAKVIWFLLSPGENAVEAFTRLNVGKIPLTNGELIRALFLGRAKGQATDEQRLRIAYEWDLLEKGLQRNNFWHFLSNKVGAASNRIGFLFDLVASDQGMQANADPYTTFYHFSHRLNAKDTDPEREWLTIKKRYMLLEEWFEDRYLYHLVGFLVWKDIDLNMLIALAEGTTKGDFKRKLLSKIFALTIGTEDLAALAPDQLRGRIANCIDDWEYGPKSQSIRSILLLFNLGTLLQSPRSNARFQFDNFKTENWHIEHVRSVASDDLGGQSARLEWLQQCLGYFQSSGAETELQAEIRTFTGLPAVDATDARFDALHGKVLHAFHEADGEPDHGVANLVLLDRATNTSYKNAPFAVKRQRVLSLDRDGIFVPLCTRNVFLKVYNAQVDHTMFWTQADREGYRQALTDVLTTFFQGAWINE